MTLYNIVDLDEKEQVDLILCIKSVNPIIFIQFLELLHSQTITTNCEVITKWHDVFLAWNPEE